MVVDNQPLLGQNELSDKLSIQPINFEIIIEKLTGMLNSFIQSIPVIILGLIAFIIFFTIGTIFRNWIKKWMANRQNYNISLVLARIIQWIFILIGFLIMLAIIFPSIRPADLLTALGIGSIALGFAFKDILQNSLSGILILIQEPFRIGDEIKYKDFEGRVEFVDTRTTFLRSLDGRRILLPNAEIYSNAITVNTAYLARCTEYDIGIASKENIDETSKIIIQILNNNKQILKHPKPEVLVINLADTITIRARWWTTPHQLEVLRIKSDILKEIKDKFHKARIEFPLPTTQIMVL